MKLKIGGFEWVVEENEEVAGTNDIFGLNYPKEQKIYLKPGLTKQLKEETLIHEVLHAIFWQTGLDAEFDDNQEEKIVSTLAHGLYQVFKDNKIWDEK